MRPSSPNHRAYSSKSGWAKVSRAALGQAAANSVGAPGKPPVPKLQLPHLVRMPAFGQSESSQCPLGSQLQGVGDRPGSDGIV